MEPGNEDEWSTWLLDRRHAGNAEYQRVVQIEIERIRDRVLDAALLTPNITLADVGAGDGLVAFGAIARIGPSLHAVLTDVSASLLAHARQHAMELGIETQCTFLDGSAEKLDGMGDATVDVVTTRAALAYVADKPAALREFFRVLKPGGRISSAEPVLRDQIPAPVKSGPAEPQPNLRDLLQRWKAAQYPDSLASPITNYSERDFVRFLCEAGFVNVHLEVHIDVRPSPIKNWDVFLDVSPHPWAAPLRQIAATRFSQAEREFFEKALRPRVETGQLVSQDVMTYFTAENPLNPATWA